MTSKEALKELCSRCYVESDLCSCHPRYNGGKVNNTCSLRDAILQDLDRLEMLEKQNKLLNETKDSVDKVLEDLGKINEENAKLKKAIKTLNRFVSLTKCKNKKTNKWEAHFMYSLAKSVLITQEEYDLLKEVLENEINK